MNPDGSGVRRLTRREGDVSASWSPDGTKVVFERINSDSDCGIRDCAAICVVDGDGQNQRCLTPVDEGSERPQWSPDGKRIAFERRDLDREELEEGAVDLYVMNADGTKKMRLTHLPGEEVEASWSPDGKQIAFSTRGIVEGRFSGDIYVVNSGGGEPTRLTEFSGEEIDPVWSPDGKRIAFSTVWVNRADVYVMNVDGSELKRLTDPPAGERSPLWSPTGDELALVREDDEDVAIVVLDEDESEERVVRRLPSDRQSIGAVAWSPDGKQLAFTEDDEAVWIVDADGRNARQIWSVGLAGDPGGLDWAAVRD